MNYPAWTGSYRLTPNGTLKRRRLFVKQAVPLFEFSNSVTDPLTLHLSATEWVRPFRHFDGFDFGSVPLALQGVVSPLAADKAFALHDSCYEFHGWWTPCGMVEITRKQADDMLYVGMRAQGCGWYTARKAWLAVRLAGGGVWRRDHDTLENLRREAQAHASPRGT
jgi:hypothetical protein